MIDAMTARLPDQRTLTGDLVELVSYVPTDLRGMFRALDHAEVWAPGTAAARAGARPTSPRSARGCGTGSRPGSVRTPCVPGSTVRSVRRARSSAPRTCTTSTSRTGTSICGWTAYTPAAWGTAVNPECKFLLLRHCFEECFFERVKIQTDLMNVRSQEAIARLGAVREGVLRHHMLRTDGSWRDTVVFSVLSRNGHR